MMPRALQVTGPALHTRAASVGSAFGTFGELLQGALPGGRDFLVTLPIARWSTATFVADPADTRLVVLPNHKVKARQLAELMFGAAGFAGGGRLRIDSDLPEGKGLASSSADLVATARAIAASLGLEVSAAGLSGLLREIEPTDGVMYDGIVAFEHKRVTLRAFLGSLPPLTIVGLDEGGTIDTLVFNAIAKPFGTDEQREYAKLLDRLSAAIAVGDLAEVGSVATRSAVLNQALHSKRTLDRMIAACRRIGGLGVVIAHSGTAVGIMLGDDDPEYEHKLASARYACRALAGNVTVFHSLCFDWGGNRTNG